MSNQEAHRDPSFSLKNRFARLVWNIFYFIFFRFSPKPFHGWRVFWLRLFGAQVGRGVHVYPQVQIWAPWNLILKDECGIANGVILYSQGKITIGRRVVVSQGSYICAGTHDYSVPGFPLITKPIVIEDFAWISAQAFVHPGVVIHQGAIIGARSVVTKNMPEWMICSGFPCVPLKRRIAASEIESFRKSLEKTD